MAYSTTGAAAITVVARGDQCSGTPHMNVAADGKTILSQDVGVTSWKSYSANATLADAPHTFTVSFTNDYLGAGCDRNLRVDSLSVASAPSGGGFLGRLKWYIDPNSDAKRQADAWRQSRPADAPGESDGTCNGGPAAGQWWADYALGLAKRAAY
jgi:hypothetical protein